MKPYAVVICVPALLAATLCGAPGAQSGVRTNWVERWVTNSIEMTVPANRFVNEYHTNYVTYVTTNVVNAYNTNLVTRFVTNRVVVDSFRTNLVRAYQTNFVPVYQTNYAVAYHTNYKTLNVTNWNTVVVLKTNWVQQSLTNVAEVDIARNEPAAATQSKTETPGPASAGTVGDVLSIDASRGTRQTAGNQADVRLKVRWAKHTETPVQVQQWKVQSEDGSILCFGQESEFRRALPFGNYKIEVKVQSDETTRALTARGMLSVTSRDVLLQPRSLAKR